MAVAQHEPVAATYARAAREKIGFWGLFGALTAYTLTTLDGGDVAPRTVSATILLVTAFCLSVPFRQRLTINVPIVCLLLMSCYSAGQTIWSPQKLIYNGWTGALFWFTAAAICLLASELFRNRRMAARFRSFFAGFGGAVCVLDLLEQASRTNKYFWLIESRYSNVSGPFSYWNNFAQFVELLLPVTLWLGIRSRKPAKWYLILSGLEIGAVVASGSRAGTVLVIAELIAVMVIAYFRDRNRRFLFAAAIALVVSVLFAYSAGFNMLSQKLQQRDQIAVRRNINLSSLAMIRARPLTGWGLETYVPVYRMFARYDDGTYVNRAHNDWLEWAAGGGILFSALMAVVFVWSIRAAVRSVWGIGLLAICVHAAVDYPFARFGVCGWYFALLGMTAAMSGDEERSKTKVRKKAELRHERGSVASA